MPMLATLSSGKKFTIITDASYKGLGYVIIQGGKFIAYPTQLKLIKLNCPSYDLEFAAMLFTLMVWRYNV